MIAEYNKVAYWHYSTHISQDLKPPSIFHLIGTKQTMKLFLDIFFQWDATLYIREIKKDVGKVG